MYEEVWNLEPIRLFTRKYLAIQIMYLLKCIFSQLIYLDYRSQMLYILTASLLIL